MQVTIPPEFERFALSQVEAGLFGSPEEAVAAALRHHLDEVAQLDALLAEGMEGEGVDAEEFLGRLLAETKAIAQSPRSG